MIFPPPVPPVPSVQATLETQVRKSPRKQPQAKMVVNKTQAKAKSKRQSPSDDDDAPLIKNNKTGKSSRSSWDDNLSADSGFAKVKSNSLTHYLSFYAVERWTHLCLRCLQKQYWTIDDQVHQQNILRKYEIGFGSSWNLRNLSEAQSTVHVTHPKNVFKCFTQCGEITFGSE